VLLTRRRATSRLANDTMSSDPPSTDYDDQYAKAPVPDDMHYADLPSSGDDGTTFTDPSVDYASTSAVFRMADDGQYESPQIDVNNGYQAAVINNTYDAPPVLTGDGDYATGPADIAAPQHIYGAAPGGQLVEYTGLGNDLN